MRSFSSYAPTPNLGSSYIGGYNAGTAATAEENQLELGREKIAADMAQSNNQMAIAGQKIQQEGVMQQMELQAKQQMFQQETMRRGQELEMEKAYREQMMGLKQAELKQSEEVNQMKAMEAMQQFESIENYKKQMADDVLWNERDPELAARDSALANLPGVTSTSGASRLFRPPSDQGFDQGDSVQGTPVYADGKLLGHNVQVSKNSSVFRPINQADVPESVSDSYVAAGNRILRKYPPHEQVRMEKELDRMQKVIDDDKQGRMNFTAWQADPKGVSKAVAFQGKAYAEAKAEVDRLKAKLDGDEVAGKGSQSSSSEPKYKEGKLYKDKDGREGRIINGQFVPIKQ